jgi:hypothetical protein
MGCNLIREIIAVHDVDPLRKACSESVTGSPYRLWCQRVVVAGNQKDRGMLVSVSLKYSGKPLPEVRSRLRIVE